MSRRASRAAQEAASWRLLGPDGVFFESDVPGKLGGHRLGRVYGRLDCRAALSAIARGGYVKHRVFFADEENAIAAGYRPCSVCLPSQYDVWKSMTAGALDQRPEGLSG